MSNIEDVESAETKMNAAREELLSSIEQSKMIDRDQYRRLVARVKKTEREFMKAIGALEE